MQVAPRRQLEDGWYLESDKDYVLNNIDLCVGLLDQICKIKKPIVKVEKAAYQMFKERGKNYGEIIVQGYI